MKRSLPDSGGIFFFIIIYLFYFIFKENYFIIKWFSLLGYCGLMFPQLKKGKSTKEFFALRVRSCAIFIWIERAQFTIPIRIAFSRCSMWLYPPAFPFSSLNLSRSIVSDFPFCRHCPFWRDSFTILRGFFCHSPPPSVMRSVSKNPMRKRR